jgi:subfamily B ATP-binding cassette protein MsbA
MIMKWFIDGVIGLGAWDLVPAVLLASIAIPVASGIVSFLNTLTIVYLGQRLVFDVRLTLYKHINNLPLEFFDRMGTGKIMSRVMGDVSTVQNMLTNSTISMVTDLVSFIFALGVTFHLNYKLALILVVVLPLYIVNYRYFIRKIGSTSFRFREKMDEIAGTLQERLSGTKLVKAYGKESAETKAFVASARQSMDLAIQSAVFSTSFSNTSRLINSLTNTVIYCLACYFVLRGEMTYGAVMAFMTYAQRTFEPALRFTDIADQVERMMVSVERIFEMLGEVPSVTDAQDAILLPPVRGDVRFEGVWFEYVPGESVLRDINLTVPAGTSVALVGQTGCGKTTLTSLLFRFYNTTTGRITIDGYDIRKVAIRSLRRQIGQVLQDSILFNTTIRENLRYGHRDATDEEIIESAKIAEIHDCILSLPKGYETVIGEGGVKLSVGEKQRMAIARAILTDPRILILDEATSSLDSESEALIQRALENAMRGRTSFIIAHRLSTIVNADLIVVMDNGKVVETGTHKELLNREDGIYKKLYEKQAMTLQEEDIERLTGS